MLDRRVSDWAMVQTTLVRAMAFLALWLILTGPGLADALFGLPVAILATFVSLWTLPPGSLGVSAFGMMRYILRLPGQSLRAGIEVARLAFQAQLAIRPGLLTGQTAMPDGLARQAFLTLSCLQPGSLPVREGPGDAVVLHSINTDAPVLAEFARAETLYREEAIVTFRPPA